MSDLRVDQAAQGTADWLSARVGYLTGSRASDIVGRRKNGRPLSGYYDYAAQIVAERLTGQSQDTGVVTPWMTRGSELEPAARAALERKLNQPIFEIGFIAFAFARIGCSIDGYINGSYREGIVELKCPKPTTHLRYLKQTSVPEEYEPQLLHNLYVTGAKTAVFASFCPQLPEPLQLAVRWVLADEWRSRIDRYAVEVSKFDAHVNAQVEEWTRYGLSDEGYRSRVAQDQ